MENYFHAETQKYIKRCKLILLIIIAPFAQAGFISAFAIILNLRQLDRDNLILLSVFLGLSVVAAMIASWVCCEVCWNKQKKHSRYTFFDIQQKAAVFSQYSGSIIRFGRRYPLRTVYVIPFKDFEGVSFEDEAKKKLIINGKIRVYFGDSYNLGYRVKDGNIVFNHWWYDETGFETVSTLKIPSFFEKPQQIANKLLEAKENYEQIPPPKQYVFKEAEAVRRRKQMELNKLRSKWN